MGRSITNELLDKSKEAMVSAVQIYNNPLIKFKSEMFIITAIIFWTYLMHAYYSKESIDYRYFSLDCAYDDEVETENDEVLFLIAGL